MSFPPVIIEVLKEYRAQLERAFPGRVRRVTLFGSVARGEATEDSDVDVLVLVDQLTFAERSLALNLGGEIGIARDLVLAPVVLTVDEWDALVRRERGLPGEIERDGVDL